MWGEPSLSRRRLMRGQNLVGGCCSLPRSRLPGGMGCGGGAFLPRADPGSAGMGRCIPGAGLCTLRSVCDLGAQREWAGAQGGGPGEAVRPPGGCLSPSLQSTTEAGGERRETPGPTSLQWYSCAPPPSRASVDAGTESPQSNLQEQVPRTAWEGP